MAAKRKADEASDSDRKPRLSAAAALRARKLRPSQSPVLSSATSNPTVRVSADDFSRTPSESIGTSAPESADDHVDKSKLPTRELSSDSEGSDASLSGSDGVFLEVQGGDFPSSLYPEDTYFEQTSRSAVFGTWLPSQKRQNVLKEDETGVELALRPGETLALLGHYEITVKSGLIAIYGARLRPSAEAYRVYASTTHPLPIIESAKAYESVIQLRSSMSSINVLEKISPSFRHLWAYSSTDGDSMYFSKWASVPQTFSFLLPGYSAALKKPLYPLVFPDGWTLAIDKIALSQLRTAHMILICGPKSTGKSTLGRILLNRLLTDPSKVEESNRSETVGKGIYVLDLDPGQPEFGPPGQLSLVYIWRPNLGPPFTHPGTVAGNSQIVRAHSIASVDPSSDPEHFILCALDLLATYRNARTLQASSATLLVNCPGFGTQGSSLDVVAQLLSRLKPNIVVCTSAADNAWFPAISAAAGNAEMVTVTPCPLFATDIRPKASRERQMISYLHSGGDAEKGVWWHANPLNLTRPWSISYASDSPNLIGILLLGEYVPPELIHVVLHRTIVSVVMVEDATAFHRPEEIPHSHLQETSVLEGGAKGEGDGADLTILSAEDVMEISDIEEETASSSSMIAELPSLVLRTPTYDLPYFSFGDAGFAAPLDPKKSRTLGHAYIQDIDYERKEMKLVSPISSTEIAEMENEITVKGAKLVLVKGKLETPGWAYLEELYLQEYERKENRNLDEDSNVKLKDGVVSSIPYVETVNEAGRGLGGGLRKTRRFRKKR